jgi:diguanylate cyclase (GGDEF)-like protein
MRPRPSILIVDDEVSNIEILNAALEDDYDICFATSGEEAIRMAFADPPDLVLLDVLMPGIDGYEVCRRLKEEQRLSAVPIIFATGLGDQDAEVRGLSLGAIDYVTKPFSPVVVRARVHNHIESKRMRDQLAELAITDALTGLSNRRRLEQSLTSEVSRLARNAERLSVVMLDIDFFKLFNDTYGHPAGDRCLALVASALNQSVGRSSDLAARYGGEEFACVLPGASFDNALVVGEKILSHIRLLEILHAASSVSSHVTASVGVATATCMKGMSPDLWIKIADRQLYAAKRSGRNRVCGAEFDARTLA